MLIFSVYLSIFDWKFQSTSYFDVCDRQQLHGMHCNEEVQSKCTRTDDILKITLVSYQLYQAG